MPVCGSGVVISAWSHGFQRRRSLVLTGGLSPSAPIVEPPRSGHSGATAFGYLVLVGQQATQTNRIFCDRRHIPLADGVSGFTRSESRKRNKEP
jgi:hypothetical protein